MHNRPSFTKDVEAILEVLKETKVFSEFSARKHSAFQNFNAILQQCPTDHLKEWITERIKTYKL